MITFDQYIGKYSDSTDLNESVCHNINNKLLPTVNRLVSFIKMSGHIFLPNPITNSIISGSGNGGFRPQNCKTGAKNSLHKRGLAIDIYDPNNYIDRYLQHNLGLLEGLEVWLELPASTYGWSHWQVLPPPSNKRIFIP